MEDIQNLLPVPEVRGGNIFACFGNEEVDVERIQTSITANEDLNVWDHSGYTPLHVAAAKKAPLAAEKLLLHGADFSLKPKSQTNPPDGENWAPPLPSNQTALNYLRRQLPLESYESILDNVFDEGLKFQNDPPMFEAKLGYITSLSEVGKETAKVKTLIDEKLDILLLHPLVQLFIHLKWEKTKKLFWFLFAIKCTLVVLLTACVYRPYYIMRGNTTSVGFFVFIITNENDDGDDESNSLPALIVVVYGFLVILMVINVGLDIIQLLRSFSHVLRLVEVVLSVTILVLSYFFVTTWKETIQFDRTFVAIITLLSYLLVWAHMSRVFKFGHSVRIYIEVFKKLAKFLLPQLILIFGFILAFALIFADKPDFSDIPRSIAKTLLIVAGDVGFPERKVLSGDETWSMYIAILGMEYLYTIYAFAIGIVLLSTLTGLAVDDTKGLEEKSILQLLKKKAILLNAVEASFYSNWAPKFIRNWITCVPGWRNENQEIKITFNPFDDEEKRLSPELKNIFMERASKARPPNPTLLTDLQIEEILTQIRQILNVPREEPAENAESALPTSSKTLRYRHIRQSASLSLPVDVYI